MSHIPSLITVITYIIYRDDGGPLVESCCSMMAALSVEPCCSMMAALSVEPCLRMMAARWSSDGGLLVLQVDGGGRVMLTHDGGFPLPLTI